MGRRILGIAIIVPIGIGLVLIGGWVFTIGAALILTIGAWEYWNIFNGSKYQLNKYFLMGTAFLSAIIRYALPGEAYTIFLFICFLFAAIYNLYRFEHGDENSLFSFSLEILGFFFISYLGSYLVLLRFLPDGKMWILLSIPAIGMGDIGAYLIGSWLGKHKMSPKVSPKKSVEGYFGGILFTVLYAVLFNLIFTYGANNITIGRSIIMGIILGIFSPVGDLVESLIKRTFNRKDAGNLIPGHGGILDRIDTLLIGGVIAYYVINYFWL